jgi:hypothetical protein
MVLWGINFWRVADLYAHYDDSEDIFSILTDGCISIATPVVSSLMVTPKWLSFPLFGNLKFCHHLRSNIPMIMIGYGYEKIVLSERLNAK